MLPKQSYGRFAGVFVFDTHGEYDRKNDHSTEREQNARACKTDLKVFERNQGIGKAGQIQPQRFAECIRKGSQCTRKIDLRSVGSRGSTRVDVGKQSGHKNV